MQRLFLNRIPLLIQPFAMKHDFLQEFDPWSFADCGAAANSSITVKSDVIVETNDETGVINHTITHQPTYPPKHQSSLIFRSDKLDCAIPTRRIKSRSSTHPSSRANSSFAASMARGRQLHLRQSRFCRGWGGIKRVGIVTA